MRAPKLVASWIPPDGTISNMQTRRALLYQGPYCVPGTWRWINAVTVEVVLAGTFPVLRLAGTIRQSRQIVLYGGISGELEFLWKRDKANI